MGIVYGQEDGREAGKSRFWNDQDEAAIRLVLTEAYETSRNNHQPAASVTDKCIDDAIFINTTGGLGEGP